MCKVINCYQELPAYVYRILQELSSVPWSEVFLLDTLDLRQKHERNSTTLSIFI